MSRPALFPPVLFLFLTLGLAALGSLVGCASVASVDRYAQDRSARLLEMYPPGKTTRSDVQTRWRPMSPDFSAERPAGGWSTHPARAVATRISAVEQSTGQIVQRCDRYWGPDGFLSGSLCYCWFYFDANDRLVSAQWQYKSD